MKIISPILTILVIFVALLITKCAQGVKEDLLIRRQADEFALHTAFDVLDYMKVSNECPKSLERWIGSYIEGGKLVLKYKSLLLRYDCTEEYGYSITVRTSLDSGQYVTGTAGSHVKYSYGHSTDSKSILLESRGEITSTLNMVFN
jgi:hypothetical protein